MRRRRFFRGIVGGDADATACSGAVPDAGRCSAATS